MSKHCVHSAALNKSGCCRHHRCQRAFSTSGGGGGGGGGGGDANDFRSQVV
jgi:hypothetical protein